MDVRTLILKSDAATQRGFPENPHPGMRVRDPVSGLVFTWVDDPTGLGDLGFWGAIIGAATGLVGMFKKDKSKEVAEQAQAEIAARDKRITELETQVEKVKSKSILNKKDLPLVAIGALLLLMFMKK